MKILNLTALPLEGGLVLHLPVHTCLWSSWLLAGWRNMSLVAKCVPPLAEVENILYIVYCVLCTHNAKR